MVEDPRHGITLKLPGKVEPDPQTGQLTTTFDYLPPYPIEELDLTIKGGERSALATPETCGTYTTKTTFTPWSAPESGPPTVSESQLTINSGANGAPCATTPASCPSDSASKVAPPTRSPAPTSPFSIHITRPDGAQEISTLDITPPPGLVASLRGVPYCSEAALAAAASKGGREEQASPSCSSASLVGTSWVGAGAGPHPYYTQGKVYLAGPYKGAPLSIAVITPAVAGPFDLGTVVVRSALYVDPETAQITAKTDPIPQILEGVPLRVRDIRVNLDRPNWTLNPTNCEAMSVAGVAHGAAGASTNLSNRFQVGGCGELAFKPQAVPAAQGRDPPRRPPGADRPGPAPEARRRQHRSALVALPALGLPRPGPHPHDLHPGPVRRGRRQRRQCPPGSIYGRAEPRPPAARLPPRTAPVYLRSSTHKLPDLVVAFQGPALPADPLRPRRGDRLRQGRPQQHLRIRARRPGLQVPPRTLRRQARA